MCGIVHGNEFVFAGDKYHLEAIAKHLGAKLKIKVAMTGRNEPGEIRVLDRSIMWAEQGIEYAGDHRATARLIDERGLRPGQIVMSPAVRESRKRCNEGRRYCEGR